ncbi:MAG: class I SAM-dependent methyltransferase [Gammaproteobacteria bacterium]|jgi:predicted O-methyltransferase YrrM
MSNRTIRLDDALYDYLLSVSLREPAVLRRLREETAKMSNANMQIAPEQGQFMALLARLIGARRYLEVGVFTGYSSLSVARALPEDGRVVACDVSREYTDVARRYWAEAGVEDRVDLRIGPAIQTLDELLDEGLGGQFDFAFIDADKGNYAEYYERCLTLLRTGGLIMVDNVLWNGRVLEADSDDLDTRAIRAFNEKVYADDRVELSLLPVADGLTLLFKR